MATANGNAFAMDLDIVREAAARWAGEEASRSKKLRARDAGKLDKVEPKARIGKRLEHLLIKLRDVKAAGEPVPANLEALIDQSETIAVQADATMLERVIGETRDFLSIEFLEGGIDASRSVGRIVTRLGGGRSSFGTGFLVAPGVLMTNHHVLTSIDGARRSVVEFNFQRNGLGQPLAVQRFELRPDDLFLNDKALDFALVAVDGGAALTRFGFCPLIGREGKILIGDPINIIQHPKGEMKQVVVRENRLLDLPTADGLDRFAHYEADTEPGSSGSPVFNDQWEVVALHHSGVPATDRQGRFLGTDDKVWKQGDDPARLKWIGNEGIRVSRLVAFVAAAALRGDTAKRLRDRVIESGERPRTMNGAPRAMEDVDPPAMNAPIDDPPPAVIDGPAARDEPAPRYADATIAAAADGLEVTIPITISVRVGGAARAARVEAAAAGELPLESGRPEPNYATRKGYDPRFVGAPVPLPKPTRAIMDKVLTLDGGGHELKYHHYSVIMNKARRLAFVSAVNFDAAARFQHERTGSDRWFFDPRIPESAQAGNEFYADNPLDRGHLTRRADAAWGRQAGQRRHVPLDQLLATA